jgi:hypothetical protein
MLPQKFFLSNRVAQRVAITRKCMQRTTGYKPVHHRIKSAGCMSRAIVSLITHAKEAHKIISELAKPLARGALEARLPLAPFYKSGVYQAIRPLF